MEAEPNKPLEKTSSAVSKPKPALKPTGSPPAVSNVPPLHKPRPELRAIGLIFLCFVAGALGSLIVLFAVNDVRQVTTNTTRQVVLSEGELISEIVDEVGQSTVSITTQSIGDADFYGRAEVLQGAGTGIIISADGYIMTNKHVIPEEVQSVSVVASDGTEYSDVKVVGRDPLNDIAFLKIEGVENLKAAKLGDSSKMEVGSRVVAIGNALGQFQNSVTTGVISGMGRPVVASDGMEAEQLENLFQTDAAINPGNSGGPLVNLEGEVIAVNTAVAEGAEGIGFAIPINDAKGLIQSVIEEGRLVRPYVGIRSITLTPDIAAELGIEAEKGAYVLEENGVVPDSPADKGGVQPGDIILRVNGQEVSQQSSVAGVISRLKVGERVEFTVLRGGQEQKLGVTLEEYPT